jgi:hypothetical protein
MKNDKKRLFEVMGRLDKTFKTRLNEDFELGGEEKPEEPVAALPSGEETQEEKTPEEKLAELTAKVDELYALLHGEEEEEVPAEETGEEGAENLQEWNFDKKKGEKKEEKPKGKTQFNFDKKEDKESKEHEDAETPAEEKKEHSEKKELDEVKDNAGKKIPVAAVAKVGK